MSMLPPPILLLLSPMVEVETFDPLHFDDFLKVEWLLTAAPFSTSTSWTDITATGLVRSVVVEQTRSGGYAGEAARTAITVELDDPDGRFNGASPYASTPYAGNIVPNRLLRVSVSGDAFSTTLPLATCFVDNISPASTVWETSTVVSASDTFRLLEADVVDWVRPAELPGQRLSALLAEVGIPSGGSQRDLVGQIDNGTVWLAPKTYNGQALAIAQEMIRAEMGLFYTDASGAFQFRDRYEWLESPARSTSQATLGGEEVEAEVIQHALSAFTDPDAVSASGESGNVFTYSSGNAPTNFPIMSVQRAGLPVLYDGDVEMCGEALQKMLEPNDRDAARPTTFRVWVMSCNEAGYVVSTSSVLSEILTGKIAWGNYVSAVYRPGGWSADYTFEGRVEAIRHVFEIADDGAPTWWCDITLGPSLNVWLAESGNHFYPYGATLNSDYKGAL